MGRINKILEARLARNGDVDFTSFGASIKVNTSQWNATAGLPHSVGLNASSTGVVYHGIRASTPSDLKPFMETAQGIWDGWSASMQVENPVTDVAEELWIRDLNIKIQDALLPLADKFDNDVTKLLKQFQ